MRQVFRQMIRGRAGIYAAAAGMLAFTSAAVADTPIQSALNPAGVEAREISSLWWLFFWVCLIVYLLVIISLAIALLRARRKQRAVAAEAPPIVVPDPASDHRTSVVIAVALGVTALILIVLLLDSFLTGRRVFTTPSADALEMKVRGHQWWWEIQYNDKTTSNMVTTANEIYAPVGRTLKIQLESNDVIHSLWIPNLNGKKDLVPGHPTTTWAKADRPGSFRGQCAEFCGMQHAKMRLVFNAVPKQEFDKWIAGQRANAPEPQTESQKHGRHVLETNTCVMCHSVQGTKARATVGPDLTHLASRKTIAAGVLPNTRGYRAGWIVDPQHLKDGVFMPPNPLDPADLHPLLDYLDTLK